MLSDSFGHADRTILCAKAVIDGAEDMPVIGSSSLDHQVICKRSGLATFQETIRG
jgi:hypothetical protein